MAELADQLKEEGKVDDTEGFIEKITSQMKEIMRLMFEEAKEGLVRKFGCFELLGFDFIIDDELNLQLIEINVNPALFTDTDVQKAILPKLIDDSIAMVLKLHDTHELTAAPEVVDEVIESTKGEEPAFPSYEHLTLESK